MSAKYAEFTQAVQELDDTFRSFQKNHVGQRDEFATRLDKVELKLDKPTKSMLGGNAEQAEETKAFTHWMRSGDGSGLQKKEMLVGTESTGDYSVPEILEDQIDSLLKKTGAMRRLATVQNIGVNPGGYKKLITDPTAQASGWVVESDTRSETGDAVFHEVSFPDAEVYSLPKISNWLLQNSQFNLKVG